ncbi:menaquinone-dependent protoporphyrinogen IX dehydrogenase [Rhodoferax sp.]|uniref:menaquinone-dependent protoporphyrinogen IX dehydrogenase n=1 Tax=Rhodoferax sp. TaxID=50421 RepID=UPI00260FD149|nr:menaquinone-dependent protoporphyrinogen IX dehydrogenase [Rhodoferax sp.]MDD5479598.1 menaquinone-dependent protoporphyrinogen IX dehydrogenase [Rhodoferax sp.]
MKVPPAMVGSQPQRVLLLYSTINGHTLHICERLEQVIQGLGHKTTLKAMAQAQQLEVAQFDRVVIGASIRYGHHRPNVKAFIDQHCSALQSRPSAFFSVNVVARKPHKATPQGNPYARKFLQSLAWQPDLAAVFAGKLDYPSYDFFDRQMIRLIMWVTHGPTDPSAVVEFTDWAQVETFGRAFCALPSKP